MARQCVSERFVAVVPCAELGPVTHVGLSVTGETRAVLSRVTLVSLSVGVATFVVLGRVTRAGLYACLLYTSDAADE